MPTIFSVSETDLTARPKQPAAHLTLLAAAAASFGVLGCAGGGGSSSGSPAGGSGGLTIVDPPTFEVEGPEGGPFPDFIRPVELKNEGQLAVEWDVQTTAVWLDFSVDSGSLLPTQEDLVTVSINQDAAATLAEGQYVTQVIFRDRNDVTGGAAAAFVLTVHPTGVGGILTVTPDEAFEPSGPEGGPVAPATKDYVVSNTGSGDLNYQISVVEPWLTLSGSTAGLLAPGHSRQVTVEVDGPSADLLAAGQYDDTVMFVNTTNGQGDTERDVVLTIDSTGGPGGRVTDGLTALYTFEEATGDVVYDVSGVAPTLDLTVQNPGAVTWQPGALSIDSPTVIRSFGAADKIIDACTATNEVTIEAWINPANVSQDGPARIITLSNGDHERNFILGQGLWGGQPSDVFDVRLNTTTNIGGHPSVTTPSGAASAELTHVVYTRQAGGTARIYVDGTSVVSDNVGGDFSSWDSSFVFALGNEFIDPRPWIGDYHLVAIYERALTGNEVEQNFQAGADATDFGTLAVVPGDDLHAQGDEGGPFSPLAKTYTVSNPGTETIQWRVTRSENWFRIVGPITGFLDPGESDQLEVRIDDAVVSAFGPGVYLGTVSFTNQTNGFGSTDRGVRLTVSDPNAGNGVTLVPGDGFDGPTSQPGPIGSGYGVDAEAIARWDVVSFQDVTGPFNVGVVAFHLNGIDRVEISVDDGPWAIVSEMSLNPRTGAWEYWATLDPALFNSPDLVELRAIVYPTTGIPRVLQGADIDPMQPNHALFLSVDPNGSLPRAERWVSPGGNDSNSGMDRNDPFETISKAAQSIAQSQGGKADGGIIYLMDGNHSFSASSVTTNERFLTLTRDPLVNRGDVVLSSSGSSGMKTKLVRLHDITVSAMLNAEKDLKSMSWADKVHYKGNALYSSSTGHTADWYRFDATDTEITNSTNGLTKYRAGLQRNVKLKDIGKDAFTDVKLVVNCEVDNIPYNSTNYHQDVNQTNFAAGQTTEYLADNRIYFGMKATNVEAQGIFCNGLDDLTYRNFAFVNVLIDKHPQTGKVSQMDNIPHFENVLMWHVSSNQPYRWRIPGHVVSNVSVRGNVWHTYRYDDEADDDVMDGTDHAHNHSIKFINSGLGDSFTPGVDFTTQEPAGWIDEDGDNYRPTAGSILNARMAPMVPIDIEGNLRGPLTAIGCYKGPGE